MGKAGKSRSDKIYVGFAAGIALPLIIFILVYFIENNQVSLMLYLKGLWHLQALIKLVSLCVFINLAIFWYFLRIKSESAARGVLGATLIYAFIVLFSRLL